MAPKSANILVLDGALGTELLSRGLPLPLPLWSADCNLIAPEDVLDIHHQYVRAGADILTTNTFRTTPRAYFAAGYSYQRAREKARESLFRAVELAQKAARDQKVWGSITALEDCYTPERSPGKSVAEEEYSELVFWFQETGVDALLFETIGHSGEAEAAIYLETDPLPKYLSLILQDPDHLLDGTELNAWLPPTWPSNAVNALLVNCTEYKTALASIRTFQRLRSEPVGAYPNLGTTQPDPEGNLDQRISREDWEQFIDQALALGVHIIGGCCGSTPDHIRLLRERVDRWLG